MVFRLKQDFVYKSSVFTCAAIAIVQNVLIQFARATILIVKFVKG